MPHSWSWRTLSTKTQLLASASLKPSASWWSQPGVSSGPAPCLQKPDCSQAPGEEESLPLGAPHGEQEYSCKQKIYLKNQQVNIVLQNGNSFLSLKEMRSPREHKENEIIWNPTTQEKPANLVCIPFSFIHSHSYIYIFTPVGICCGRWGLRMLIPALTTW